MSRKADTSESNITRLKKWFSSTARKFSEWVGYAVTFVIALIVVIIWAILGPFYHYSDTWQLVMNTTSSIFTFLIVFLIQNTQNRDTEMLKIKLDELIRAQKSAKNSVIDLDKLTDDQLKKLEQVYINISESKHND